MDQILADLNGLDSDNLRSELTKFGESVGPIPENAKFIFQKKLAKLIYKQKYGVHYESGTDIATQGGSNANNKLRENCECDVEKSQVIKPQVEALPCQTPGHGAQMVQPESSVFYGVCLPTADRKSNENTIFTEKTEALALVKKMKGSRFKTFKSYEDARQFSLMSEDDICPSPLRTNQPVKEGNTAKESASLDVEKSIYKAPKVPELHIFRKAIERGDIAEVSKLVWENPRYLVSSCDTPVILQEGFRYNALHVAAKSNKPKICELIIHTIENPQFIEKLYSNTKETEATRTKRINFLIDLYINMPDKGFFESPLHFACKFGFAEVVEVLVVHPLINFSLKNRYGQKPRDVLCTRSKIKSEENKKQIEELLEGQVFVPLMRYEDNSVAPLICDPLSPDKMYTSTADFPITNSNHRDPRYAVRALAGPMSPSKAQLFHKKWTTPPPGHPDQKKQFCSIKRGDCDKGLERIGRGVAHDLKVPWKEYWDFMSSFADLTSSDGLQMLEDYLKLHYVKRVVAAENKFANEEYCGGISINSFQTGNSLLDSVPRRSHSTSERVPRPTFSLTKNVCPNVNEDRDSSRYNNSENLDTSCDILKDHSYKTDSDVTDSPNASTNLLKHKLDFDCSINDSMCLDNDTSFNFRSPFVLKDSLSIDSDSDLSNLSRDSYEGVSTSKGTSALPNRYLTSSPVLKDKIHLEDDYEDILADAMFKQLKLSDSSLTSPVKSVGNDCQADLVNGVSNGEALNCDNGADIDSDEDLDYLSAVSSLESQEFSDAMEDDPTPNLILTLSCEDDMRLCSCNELVLIERNTLDKDNNNTLLFNCDVFSAGCDKSDQAVKLKNVVVTFKSKHDSGKLFHINPSGTVNLDVILKKTETEIENSILKTALFVDSSLPGVSSLFITGYQPTKTDVDVYRAVEMTPICLDEYPFIYHWKDTVLSFSEPDRKGWPSPANLQRRKKVTRLQNVREV